VGVWWWGGVWVGWWGAPPPTPTPPNPKPPIPNPQYYILYFMHLIIDVN